MGKITGLYVGGTIQERRRRFINRENNERVEVVTYTPEFFMPFALNLPERLKHPGMSSIPETICRSFYRLP